MTVLNKLATSLNRRDEVPNQELGQRIVSENNAAAVKELIGALHHGDKAIQSRLHKSALRDRRSQTRSDREIL